jgi:hypothetical protein
MKTLSGGMLFYPGKAIDIPGFLLVDAVGILFGRIEEEIIH